MYKLALTNPLNGKGLIETFKTVKALNEYAEQARAIGLIADRRKDLEQR